MAAEYSSEMYYAVTENDAVRLENLITSGGDVDQFYDDVTKISSRSLLHVCCGRGHVQCLRVLIEHGAKLDVRDDWGQTPLMYSVSIQFPEAAQVLLEANPDLINCQDRFGKSPLHCAVSAQNVELARLLLRFGADVNVRCHERLTPLMYCGMADPEGSKVKVMAVLLEAGSLVDLTDYRGRRTALHIAVSAGNVRAVEMLISAGADVNCIEKTLRVPLTLAITGGMKGALVDEVFAQIISLLVSAGANLDMSVNESCNALMTSALLKSEPAVRYFLSLGANPDVTFYSGVSPVLVCASTGDLPTLRALIQYNCCLTTRGSVYKRRRRVEDFLDAFELSYTEGHLGLCTLMVEAGYSVHRLQSCFLQDFLRETSGSGDAALISHLIHPHGDTDTSNTARVGLTPGEDELNGREHKSLTLAHAPRLPQDWRETLLWLITKASNARSLKEESACVIRSSIGHRLFACVDDLPLPKLVKQYLVLGHLGLDEPVHATSFLGR